jgi:hypothetical protein
MTNSLLLEFLKRPYLKLMVYQASVFLGFPLIAMPEGTYSVDATFC